MAQLLPLPRLRRASGTTVGTPSATTTVRTAAAVTSARTSPRKVEEWIDGADDSAAGTCREGSATIVGGVSSSVTAWTGSGRARGGGATIRPGRTPVLPGDRRDEAKEPILPGRRPADTFTATVVVTVHPRRWSRKALAAFLKRHREFCIGGPAGKGGLLLEIVPNTLRKTKPC